MVKFNKRLEDFDAILSFDLAQFKTGISVYSIQEKKIVKAWAIEVKKTDPKPLLSLYWKLKTVLRETVEEYGKIIVIKESAPLQAGKFTTAQTLITLGKCHGLLDVLTDLQEGVEPYDDVGVHSVSVKAFYRSKALPKPEKSDIRKAVVEYYDLDDTKLTDDISDSIAVTHTLVHRKWNQDIDDEIKRIKKEIKTLKAQKAIELRQEKIQELTAMKL